MDKLKKEGLKQLGSLILMATFATVTGSFIGWETSNYASSHEIRDAYVTVIFWVTFTGIWWIFLSWIRKIKPFHKGVLLILGRPVSWTILPSGFIWLLPKPFMDLIQVDVRQKDLDVKIEKALSRDNVKIEVDVLVKASVTDPFQWLKTEEPDKALMTLVQRNIRVFTNMIKSEEMPGQEAEFSHHLENGVVFNKDGEIQHGDGADKIRGNIYVESVSKVTAQWGYGDGINKVIINKIHIPDEMVEANIAKRVEDSQVETESTQQNLFLTLLGGGDLETGREVFLAMTGEERAKIIQGERGKRTIVTVDGNSSNIVKALVAGATTRR